MCGIKYQGHFVNKMCFWCNDNNFYAKRKQKQQNSNCNSRWNKRGQNWCTVCCTYKHVFSAEQTQRCKRVVVKWWWRWDEITSTAEDYITHLLSNCAHCVYIHTRGLVLTLLLIRFLDIMLTSLFQHNLLFLFSAVSSSKLLENTHNAKVHKIQVFISCAQPVNIKFSNAKLRNEKKVQQYIWLYCARVETHYTFVR